MYKQKTRKAIPDSCDRYRPWGYYRGDWADSQGQGEWTSALGSLRLPSGELGSRVQRGPPPLLWKTPHSLPSHHPPSGKSCLFLHSYSLLPKSSLFTLYDLFRESEYISWRNWMQTNIILLIKLYIYMNQ